MAIVALSASIVAADADRLVSLLHGCLRTHTAYNEDTAWAHRTKTTDDIAA